MILYIGNILSKRGGSVGFIETMTPRLADRYQITSVSSVRSRVLRLAHMLFTVWKHRKRCKIVLIDTFSSQAFWFSYSVAKLCYLLSIPYIPIVRGGNFADRLAKSREGCDWLFSKSGENIVPSRFLEGHFKKAGYAVRYIPNFIELGKYPFKLREHLRAKILWVRAFHKIYNPLMAIEVLARLDLPEVELCMVGSDTDGIKSEVENRIREFGLGDRIKLPGRLLKKDWIKLSESYDIFINTTTIDNMPVSVIEAMALGFPVVSTDVGGVPYLLKDSVDGILVSSGNVDEMTNAIRKLIDNPRLARSLSLSAREKVEAFDWEKVKLDWFEILDKFVGVRVDA